jgi:hypothetical protein
MRKAIPRSKGPNGIIPFLEMLASDGHKTVKHNGRDIKVDMAFFEEAWGRSQDSVDVVKDRFRGAMDAHHEWLPSNKILDVLKLARQTAGEGKKWIELQHELRSETFRVVFKPTKSSKVVTASVAGAPERNYTVPQGHSGAVYYNGEQQTVGQEDFHNQLRDALANSQTVQGAASAALGVATEWIWRGEDMDPELHPECYNKRSGGSRITPEGQRAHFEAIANHFKPYV